MIKDYKDVNGLEAKHKVNKKKQWEPPPEVFYLINVDGAIPLTNRQSEVGMLNRDWNRRVIATMFMSLKEDSLLRKLRQLQLNKA